MKNMRNSQIKHLKVPALGNFQRGNFDRKAMKGSFKRQKI